VLEAFTVELRRRYAKKRFVTSSKRAIEKLDYNLPQKRDSATQPKQTCSDKPITKGAALF
jgi:hypothetical protein